jgi:subtilase family serine protease
MNLARNRLVAGCVAALAAIIPSLARGQSFTPSGIQQAYGLNLLAPSYTGAGQTIALIEVGGATGTGSPTNLYDDVNLFDSKFGVAPLTAGTNLTVMNQSGGTSPSSLPSYYSAWTEETTLDVEYAHAIAPGANIEVVEASQNGNVVSNIYAATSYAAAHGASVISLSLTISPEDSTSDSYFTAGQNAGTVFVASSGDGGADGTVLTPASDSNVVAVGGTMLSVNSNGSYAGETAWSGSGGGVSSYELRPTYQSQNKIPVDPSNPGNRTVPDVAFDASPSTPVQIYYDGGLAAVGGTSVGAPCWAGLFALADQQLAAADKPLLSSVGALEAMYATYGTEAYSYAFHDIVGGSNGSYQAVAGYDEVTGLGSPVANELVPYLGGELTLAQLPEPTGAVVMLVALPMMLRRRRGRGR